VEGGRFRSHDRNLTTERAWAVRSERIQATLREVRPEVVLVELFPFGRAKFARELVPLLEAAHALGALTACSLRDILVSSRANQRAYDDRARELADAHLDAVLVHGDPRFARLEETFSPTTPLRTPIHYTGFVTNLKGTVPFREREPVIVVSAGGGRVGEPLLRAALESTSPRGMRLRAIAGPLMPEEAFHNLKRPVPLPGATRLTGTVPGWQVVRSVPDLGVELARASGSVSQCGYNTALDILRTRVPALVVPYATPEEDEQMRRARRLERLGLLRVSDLDRLSEDLQELAGFRPSVAALDLDGARRTTDLLWDLRPARAAA
jgi:predicted glycosyltransferase